MKIFNVDQTCTQVYTLYAHVYVYIGTLVHVSVCMTNEHSHTDTPLQHWPQLCVYRSAIFDECYSHTVHGLRV